MATVKRRFTADEYQHMGRAGILPEDDRVELIDGEIVAMTPIGSRHAACVSSAAQEFARAAINDAQIRSQNPVRLDLYDEPEPDLVLVQPRADFYASGHPTASDIVLIIEIADSSLEYDRDVKAPLYAVAAIPEYWLVDLNSNVVRRFSSPERGRYTRVEECRRGESMAPLLLPACVVPVDALLIE
jgi:Uma2 family endonuclease